MHIFYNFHKLINKIASDFSLLRRHSRLPAREIVSHTSGIIMMPDNAIWSAIRISRSFLKLALAPAISFGHTTQWHSVTAALDTWKIEETAWRPPFVGSFNFCRRIAVAVGPGYTRVGRFGVGTTHTLLGIQSKVSAPVGGKHLTGNCELGTGS